MASVVRGLGRYLARSKDIDLEPELDAIAAQIESYAVGLAADHIDTGEFARSIQRGVDRVSPSGRDRVVYSDDPNAVSIEYGHNARTKTGLRPVDGLHILGRAADAV